MISQYNVVYTVEQLRECLPLRRLRGHAGRVVPADGAHRRADDEPLPAAHPRLQRVLLPGCRSAHDLPERGAPADRLRRAARVREDLQRRQRRARGRPGTQAAVRRRRRRGGRDQARRARRHRHPGAARHVGVPRRGGVQPGAGAGRSRRGGHRDHGRGADPGDDPRVVRGDRRAVVGDLRHERVERADDVVARTQQARLRRAGDPRVRGDDRRRRGGDLPRRQRVPGLLRAAGEDGRHADRRLAAHRRHRRVRRRGLPPHRRPQEGADHHVGRQEHQPRQPRGVAQDDPAHRSGGGDRRQPQVRVGAARARSGDVRGVGGGARQARRDRRKSWRPTRT